jgi:hypothetical protein
MARRGIVERLISWTIVRIARIAGFIAPWVILAIVFSFTHTLVAFWKGVETTTNDIANEWLWRAAGGGFFTVRSPQLRQTIRVVATIVIVFEWVIFSFTTVFLIAVIV